jgi:hypothetical protein
VRGLSDVYLGAPVAPPLDPRHRLVTTKYIPARTWTAENAVGIGRAYLCGYGTEGLSGYQLVGRTLQMWNRFRRTAEFEAGKPWLLRFFDPIRFYPLTAAELERIRRDFPLGRYPPAHRADPLPPHGLPGVARRPGRVHPALPPMPKGGLPSRARAPSLLALRATLPRFSASMKSWRAPREAARRQGEALEDERRAHEQTQSAEREKRIAALEDELAREREALTALRVEAAALAERAAHAEDLRGL